MKVLIFAPAPLYVSPSQRFRYVHYLDAEKLPSQLHFDHHAFFSEKTWDILFQKGHFFQKTLGIFIGFLRTFFVLLKLGPYDMVYVHRGIAPVGPPVFEWIISRVFRKKMIFDFDDAIWVRTASHANPLAHWLKFNSKVKKICSYSHIVTVGNEYLKNFALKYNRDVRVIPTVVDTENYHNRIKDHSKGPLVIGWTGTFTNFSSLQTILPVIKELSGKYEFTFSIIADRDPLFEDVSYQFKKWNLDTEIEDLLQFSIGIMPLVEKEMDKGKCAFKAIQYMSLGIPVVLSPIGANKILVDHGINGFLTMSMKEWKDALEKLLLDASLRTSVGAGARQKIIDQYSVQATRQDFIDLFEEKD